MTNSAVDILLVEDNADDVELTLQAFESFQAAYHIHVVRDGAEALDFAFARGAYAGRDMTAGPKVILLDLKLPLIDGLEVLRQLKADARTQMTPVVVLTSSHEERDLVESYRLGANSYVVKPIDFEQFAISARQLGLYWLVLNESIP